MNKQTLGKSTIKSIPPGTIKTNLNKVKDRKKKLVMV